jgi:hypothetical protein
VLVASDEIKRARILLTGAGIGHVLAEDQT